VFSIKLKNEKELNLKNIKTRCERASSAILLTFLFLHPPMLGKAKQSRRGKLSTAKLGRQGQDAGAS